MNFVIIMMLLFGPFEISNTRLIVMAKEGQTSVLMNYLKKTSYVKSVTPLFKSTSLTHEELFKKYALNRYLLVELRSNNKGDLLKIKKELEQLPDVAKVEFDYVKKLLYVPNDPFFKDQWALFKVEAQHAWNLSTGTKKVKIVVDDTGVDWKHEDLLDNLWQNLAEDADGDGHVIELVGGEWQFDPGDINGVDDDGDGLVDDFIGWNFFRNNNNPEPDSTEDGYYHGTHVAGICSAVADNSIGIASLAFSASIVAVRSHYVSNSSYALQWAADMGFDIFNMSWGISYNTSYLENAINYAHDAGVLLIAAAGNDSSSDSTVNWPAAYSNVVAVAATNRNDQHSYYTNYGTWVDIAAPGGDYYVDNQILSTLPKNDYGVLQGTSMASPMVASLAALVKSIDTSLANDSIRSILENTADSIDDIYFQQGLLGSGRINAYKALRSVATDKMGWLYLQQYSVDPEIPESGDTVVLTLRVADSSEWLSVNNSYVKIFTEDTFLVLMEDSIFIGNIPSGTFREVNVNFIVRNNNFPHYASFILSYTADEQLAYQVDTITILLGSPEVLVVDDAANGGLYEHYYHTAFDSVGVVYDYWQISDSGAPSTSVLVNYKVVLWFTGKDTTALSPAEIDTIEAAMDMGVDFIISSQYLYESNPDTAFLVNYLGVCYDSGYIRQNYAFGVEGDVIGNGLKLTLVGAGGASDGVSKDVFHGCNGGITFLNYGTTTSYGGAAVRYDRGNNKVVTFAFPFECINDYGENKRGDLLARIFAWFGVVTNIEENYKRSLTLSLPPYTTVIARGTTVDLGNLCRDTKIISIKLYDVSGKLIAERRNLSVPIIRLPHNNKIYFAHVIDYRRQSHIVKILSLSD